MAVQLLNDMPDAEFHRGEPIRELLRELNSRRPPKRSGPHLSGRAIFLAATIALHVAGLAAFMQLQTRSVKHSDPPPIVASLIETPVEAEETPPQYTPPPLDVIYSLPPPQDVAIEVESITLPPPTTTAIAPNTTSVAPPLIDSVEYVRTAPPLYPRESQRKREHGTVVLRVLVDAAGRPAQVEVENSSGHERLDVAAREAVLKFQFKPHVVDGVAKAAQVLIPIGFEPHKS